MKLKSIIFPLIFILLSVALMSCRQHNQQGKVTPTVQSSSIPVNATVENYKPIDMVCDREELPSQCTNETIDLSVVYRNTADTTIITISKDGKTFNYDMGFYFEGLNYETYAFENSGVILIMVNLIYEYNSDLLVFQSDESATTSYIGKLHVESSDQFITNEGINIEENSKVLKITINEKPFILNKLKGSGNNSQIGKYKNLENWFGNYESSFEVDKLTESHSIKLELFISEESTITFVTDGKITKENELTVIDFSENEITLQSLTKKEIYMVTKQSNTDYIISGRPIYLINPPNREYTIKKI